MGMSLKEFYERLDGNEIDERLALAIADSPEFKKKMADEAEQERINNLTPEERAAELMRLLNAKKEK